MEESFDCDVLVVGAGAAGLRAAIEASAGGARTAIACKSLLGKAATVMEREGIELPLVAELESWGAIFDRMPRAQLAHRDERTGLEVLRALQNEVVRRGIEVHMECAIQRLLLDDGRVTGAVAIRRASGGFVHFRSKAIVLATGGYGRAWQLDASSADATGDGHALALDAGASLVDMEPGRDTGGVRVDARSGASGVPGLYAAGDVAADCNDLSGALMSGRRAGLHAAQYGLGTRGHMLIDVERLDEIGRELLAPLERRHGENPYAIHSALRDARTLDEIRGLKTRAANVSAPGPRAYNPAWQLALELRAMLAVAEAAALAALEPVRAEPGSLDRLIDWSKTWLARKPRSASGAATRAAGRSKITG